ncbi:hypothetical protein QQS21_003066 [Conoideocrella luteorostrata]|uniref:DUF6604 domain-containing protein n=1 Tax=Conoideocrella luteorostrata TaxID=1105319 RepID=A0AAJ0CWS7_9HYPO|nr:hypothetical protein QQS21_003066 [Conoideocrella luteorostrata]
MDIPIVLLYIAIIGVPTFVYSLTRQLRKTSTPIKSPSQLRRFPGPKQFPLVGRVHDLPKGSLWRKFHEWAIAYGPIYETSMMGQRFIIISNEEMAQELLIKNGNHFSGRVQIRALIDHKTSATYVALQDRNESWKIQRKWVHAAMAAAYQENFYGRIEKELKRFMMTLILDPAKFHANTRELTGRIMSTLAWDDAALGKRYGERAIETLTQMSVSGPIVNTVTPIWHIAEFLGYNPWRKHEEAREGSMRAWWADSLRVAKARFLKGDLPGDTWSYRYCEQLVYEGNKTLEQSLDDENFAACMLGFQCMVGVITVGGPLQYFLMCMALHPQWLKRVQEEIDRVCGERLPTIGDYAELPTVRACVKETLRWRSTVPLGVPHLCETPAEYMGVPIQKGDVILACEWSLNRDEAKFPDAEMYHPERWLEPSWPTYMEPISQYPNLREGKAMHTFGWGRRSCLGPSMADYEMFMFAAYVCWGFDLSLKKCPITGEDMTFDTYSTNSRVILEPNDRPMPFHDSYLAYKRDTSRLVYLLVTASNAVLSARDVKATLNTTGKLFASEFVPAAKLIAKHMKETPCEILNLLKSVIKLRSSRYEEFQRRVSANPNFEMGKSNGSHKHFIDILSQTFDILGGEKRLKDEKARRKTKQEAETTKVDFQTMCSNVFSHLNLHGIEDSDEGSDGGSSCTTEQRNLPKRFPGKACSKGSKRKGGKGKSARKKANVSSQQKHLINKIPVEKYGIAGDDSQLEAEYFLAAAAMLEQCIELRLRCQSFWERVAYDSFHPVVAVAICEQAISMVIEAQTAVFSDFPNDDSYIKLLKKYTSGDTSNMQQPTILRISRRCDDEVCSPFLEETAVTTGSMKELLMEYTYNDLLEFIRDYQKTSTGKPTKSMQAEIRRWNPKLDLGKATGEQRRRWRRIYTIDWLYCLVGSFSETRKRIEMDSDVKVLCKVFADNSRPCHNPALKRWDEESQFFGLRQFTDAITVLIRQADEAKMQDSISPYLVFNLQCIVDSCTVSLGWKIDVAGDIILGRPADKGGSVDWMRRFTCANTCEHHLGVSRSIELLLKVFKSHESPSFYIGHITLSTFWKSFLTHHQIMVDLVKEEIPCIKKSGQDWQVNEHRFWNLSPFVCASSLMQAIELFFRYAMFIWDVTPEIGYLFHLHNMLVQEGYLDRPVELLDEVGKLFMADFFGDKLPESNFSRAYRKYKNFSRPPRTEGFAHLLINSPFYKQFFMTEYFHQTKSSLLVFHEAGWNARAISATRLPNTSIKWILMKIAEKMRDQEAFDTRKHFTKMSKNGNNLRILQFDTDTERISESFLLDLTEWAIENDIFSSAALSNMNFLGITAKLLSIWIAIAEKTRTSRYEPHTECCPSTLTADDIIYSILCAALDGDDDDLLRMMAAIFDENRGERTISFAYFPMSDPSR